MNSILLGVLTTALALSALGCASSESVESPVQTAGPSVELAAAGARTAAKVFISGHSLVDQPLPTFLAQIAQTTGTPLEWNRQYMMGSSILSRTQGSEPGSQGWAGYRSGDNREGSGLDVLAELKSPKTVSGPYDVLLITEQHGLLETLVWNDTVRHLRHFHDRFIEGNARGTTYFYEAWLSLKSKDDPTQWIAYERMASPIWQCMATRVNLSLQVEGRSDRIVALPAATALAELIEKATQGSGVPGITGSSVRETVDRIVHDDVHLTPLGSYYMALATYAALFRRVPGDWFPENVTAEQASALRQVAADFMTRYYANYQPLSPVECQARLESGVIGDYWSYVRDSVWRQDRAAQAYVRWLRRWVTWRYTLTREDDTNPFYFNASTDRSRWLPAP